MNGNAYQTTENRRPVAIDAGASKMNLNKRERKAAQLLSHYAKCEQLAAACGLEPSKIDGKRISVALSKLEETASDAAVAYCNGDRLRIYWPKFGSYLPMPDDLNFHENGSEAWERVKIVVTDCVRNVLGSVPPGFFVNGDPRGYAMKIDNEKPEGAALIASVKLHTDLGGYGILSPEITGN